MWDGVAMTSSGALAGTCIHEINKRPAHLSSPVRLMQANVLSELGPCVINCVPSERPLGMFLLARLSQRGGEWDRGQLRAQLISVAR